MTFPSHSSSYAVAFGTANNEIAVPVYSTRAPTTFDVRYPIGKRWINMAANAEYVLTSFAALNPPSANWITTLDASVLVTLTGDTGGAISPTVGGNITLAGTAGQIVSAGSGNTITFSLASSLVVP